MFILYYMSFVIYNSRLSSKKVTLILWQRLPARRNLVTYHKSTQILTHTYASIHAYIQYKSAKVLYICNLLTMAYNHNSCFVVLKRQICLSIFYCIKPPIMYVWICPCFYACQFVCIRLVSNKCLQLHYHLIRSHQQQ